MMHIMFRCKHLSLKCLSLCISIFTIFCLDVIKVYKKNKVMKKCKSRLSADTSSIIKYSNQESLFHLVNSLLDKTCFKERELIMFVGSFHSNASHFQALNGHIFNDIISIDRITLKYQAWKIYRNCMGYNAKI